MTQPDHIARIDALTRNARNTWFVLLGALVFVGITLMGVEHIDFYGVDRATKLPLVDVFVPTRYFFVAAPILVAAVYGYFHLYLIRLWDALGAAPARIEGQRLGDAITPWLVSDAALHLRRRWRRDGCTTPRPLEGGAMLLNLALAWGFGLFVLAALWWMSMPARDWRMTAVAALALFVSLFAGAASLAALHHRLSRQHTEPHQNLFATAPAMSALIVVIPMLSMLSLQRTEGDAKYLAPLIMIGEDIVERPPGWLPHDIARKDFLADWCKRDGAPCKLEDLSDDQRRAFDKDWTPRRAAALADMRRPDWHKPGRKPKDFRGADLSRAYLAGLNLSGAQMEGADLSGAQMEGADLSEAQMAGADLSEAQMAGANLDWANMEWADLGLAQMEGTGLGGAQLKRANLWQARMERANLSLAQMEEVTLNWAHMEGADLSFTFLTGWPDEVDELRYTDLSAARNLGGALRSVSLISVTFDAATDFRNAFFDGSVTLPDAFRAQMGDLCQTRPDVLDDAEFFGRWRGWIETESDSWHFIAPPGWENVTPIPPPEGCEWKTGPMPGTSPPAD